MNIYLKKKNNHKLEEAMYFHGSILRSASSQCVTEVSITKPKIKDNFFKEILLSKYSILSCLLVTFYKKTK